MSFVLVTADFPEIERVEFDAIFNKLQTQNWVKMHDHILPVNTIWFYGLVPEQPEEAIKIARHNFTSCCIPFCIPRLALEWGASEHLAITH